MARKQKYYLTIPSKNIIEEFDGIILDLKQFAYKTPRGKIIKGWTGLINGEKIVHNYFCTTQTEAKALVSFINGWYKKIESGKASGFIHNYIDEI